MSKLSRAVAFGVVTFALGFATTAHANPKQDCLSGLKEVEAQYANAGGLSGKTRRIVDQKLPVAKQAQKGGQFKKCVHMIAEIKNAMHAN